VQILKVKRVAGREPGLKIYGQILGDSGETYNFAYIRRKTFRGWLCSCTSFMLGCVKDNRNCKHLHYVRAELGRYGSRVPKTAVASTQA
jgi:predicted nucleic acid-binding Zn finger protein